MLTLNEVWAARNLFTFENKRLMADIVIHKIKRRIHFSIKVAYNLNLVPGLIKSWAYRKVF